MLCTELTAVKQLDHQFIGVPLKCRRWSCPYCAPTRKSQLRRLARSGEPTTFLTLTCNPAIGSTRDWRAAMMARNWRILRRAIMRKYNLTRLPFLAVFERTKRGEPHLHILLRAPFIPQRWLSAQWARLTGAPIVDIRQVFDEHRVALYVSKYIAKDPVQFTGCKRYWRSQDYAPPTDEDDDPIGRRDDEWEIRPIAYDAWCAGMEQMGYQGMKYGAGTLWWPP